MVKLKISELLWQNCQIKERKNPNKCEEVSLREPKEILEEMNSLDKETNQILEVIKKLI